MKESPAARLRAALEDLGREVGREVVGPLSRPFVELGRPLLADGLGLERVPHDAPVAEAAGGLAWGSQERDALAAWMARVPVGSVAAHVFASERAGPRGVLDRLMLMPSRERPRPLEEVCTTLFLLGVGAQRVIALEPHRNVVGVIGVRRF
jgi:hypothetical protein